MARLKVNQVLSSKSPMAQVLIKGWIRTRRDSREFSFLELNDGSCLNNLQIIADATLENYDAVKKLNVGSAVAVTGSLVISEGKGQAWEIKATGIDILGSASDTYPLQKKRHTDEFLRGIAHLRPRTNKYGATFRIRSSLSWAIHRFFRERGFYYVHTPIITASDCEGAGEMFRVTTLDDKNPPQKNGRANYEQDFFGTMANLTVSGQLTAEMLALALGDVYTFGPTFRAENSNTRRHAADFFCTG
jgi:asparaginyl-tRNA synthetase